MAGVFVTSTSSTKKYAGRVTAFVVATCLVSATRGLIFGYDLGISGGVTSMDPFLKKFFPNVFQKLKQAHTNAYCKFDDQLLTTFTSSLYIAGLIASFFASTSTRLLGLKPSILFGGLTFLTGAALNAAAANVVMLILGRICLGIGVGFTNQVAIAVLLGINFGGSGEGSLSKGCAVLVVVFVCVYVFSFGFSWGPLGWLVPSEIFPLEIRSAGQSITVTVNLLFTFVVAQAFLAMLCHFKYGLFLFFACGVVVMTAFVYWLLPETKNVPIEEMGIVWKEHWFWRRFQEEEEEQTATKITAADKVP